MSLSLQIILPKPLIKPLKNCEKKGKRGCIIYSYGASFNDLPWRDKFHVDYVGIDGDGRLDMEDLGASLKIRRKSKACYHDRASNVSSYINPIHKAAEWLINTAQKYS